MNTQTSGNIYSSRYGNNVSSNYFQTTTSTPENGIIGYSQETVENTNNISYLTLKAAILDNQQQLYPIWAVVVLSQINKLNNFEMIKSLSNISSDLANKNTGDIVPIVTPLK